MATESFTATQERIANLRIIALKSRWMIFERNSRLWMIGILMISDLSSLLASIILALQIRGLPHLLTDPSYVRIFFLLAITLVVMFANKSLYPGMGLNSVDELRLIVTSMTIAFSVILGITFMLKTTEHYSRLVLLIAWLLSLVFIPISRSLIRRWMIDITLWGEPVVIIGNSDKISAVADYFSKNLQWGLRPTAVLHNDTSKDDIQSTHSLESLCTLQLQAQKLSVQTALVVINDFNDIDLLVEQFRAIFQRVILIKDKNGQYGLNSLEALDFSHVLGLQVKNNLLDPWPQTLKRLIDILGSILGLLILAPLLGLIALCIVLDAPGRVFYRQSRLGHNGKTFKLLKFRTMHLGAGQILADAFAQDPALKLEWDSYQKLRKDPRITRVGKFLRKFSLDELPQLWNVFRGEMSLVGPRPIMVDQRDLYGEALHNYTRVTPGMTGLWQVSGRNQTTFLRRAEFDSEYIQCWSVWLDIYILFKTLDVVLWQKGAY